MSEQADNNLQRELKDLKERVSRIEEDTGSVVLIQNRLLTSVNDLQASILKLRESLLRVKDRLG